MALRCHRRHPHVDNTLVKAIARAFRCEKMPDTSGYATIKEIARQRRSTHHTSSGYYI